MPNSYFTRLRKAERPGHREGEWRRSAGVACRRARPHRRASGSSTRPTAAFELATSHRRHPCTGRLTTHVNKVSSVESISRVAEELGEDEVWLLDVAADMEPEDGVIWVYGIADEGVMAFTEFGVDSLVDLIKMHKDDPSLLERGAEES